MVYGKKTAQKNLRAEMGSLRKIKLDSSWFESCLINFRNFFRTSMALVSRFCHNAALLITCIRVYHVHPSVFLELLSGIL